MSAALPRIGHNQGPPLEAGDSFVGYCWRRAHKRAWRTPPIETVHSRCRRAAEIGLGYRAYTAILLDRGSHVRALFFDLAGTLIAGHGDDVRVDALGRIRPLAGVTEKLARLADCLRFVVANQAGVAAETARSFIEQIDQLCGRVLTDYRICWDPADSGSAERKPRPGMVLALLSRHSLAPALAVMIGDGREDRLCAEAARLAAFFDADAYFGRVVSGALGGAASAPRLVAIEARAIAGDAVAPSPTEISARHRLRSNPRFRSKQKPFRKSA